MHHLDISEKYKQMMGDIMQEKFKNPFVKTLLAIERFLSYLVTIHGRVCDEK